MADPTLAQDAATKAYVDAARAGISGVKDPVRVAAQTNVNLAAVYGRCYVYFTGNPASVVGLVRLRNGTTQTARIIITTTGKVQLNNSANTSVGITTASIALNQWMRIEWKCLPATSNGTLEAKVFNTADSATPTETLTVATAALTAACDEIQWGHIASNPGATFYLDSIAASSSGYPGPEAAAAFQGGGTDMTTSRHVSESDANGHASPSCILVAFDPLTTAQHRAIQHDVLADQLEAVLNTSRWAVACVGVQGGGQIVALNVYDDLPAALNAYDTLTGELAPHPQQQARLVPVGPVTGQEMAAAGLITSNQ